MLLTPNAIGGFTPYTPTVAGATSGGTLGNGTANADYMVVGNMCVIRLQLIFGSTTSFGTGGATITLPIAADAIDPPDLGSGLLLDSSVPTRLICVAQLDTTSRFIMVTTAGAVVAGTVPWTWAVNDQVRLSLTYRI
jgi:hypothetical protein